MQIRQLVCVALIAAAAHALAHAAAAPTEALHIGPELRTRPLKLLYVMEYDCMFDWEPVHLEKGLTDDMITWMLNLQDRLTVTAQQPLGEELVVSAFARSPLS